MNRDCWRRCAFILALGSCCFLQRARGEGEGAPSQERQAPAPERPGPPLLTRPAPGENEVKPEPPPLPEEIVRTPVEAPLGFTGPSGVLPVDYQTDLNLIPREDRWRIGFPAWDRYGKGHPWVDDYPYVEGHWWDPYNQNVLKGDYPIIGQHTFLNITGTSLSVLEYHQIPTPTTPFESTLHPFEEQFFGDPDQFFYTQFFKLSFDLFHGDAAFKPVDWRVKLTPIFNVNALDVNELAIVNPNVLDGVTRNRTWFALEEAFIEAKLADLSPDYDFASVRVGNQPFVSDFRGFIFADINKAVRLFGTSFANRDQFNLLYFRQWEKDTNSELNTFHDRNQDIAIANYYRQDFIFPGYTAQLSFLYNRDGPSFKFNKNDFLVRPDAVGVFQEHEVEAYYIGWNGDGHIGRFNITHAFYWAFGRDTLNPLANRPIVINAQMAACELSYDRDWARFRTSLFWSSGDGNINNRYGCGFDTILDNPNFAGGEFSYWQRQAIPLFGVNLVNRLSLVPDLRSSKIQGQSNFVNPGLFLLNYGVDFDITPKLKMINNLNFLWFEETQVLEQFVFQDRIEPFIGTDLSTGFEYRPFLNNNMIVVLGASALFPGGGFHDLYDNLDQEVDTLFASFVEVVLTY